MNDLKKFFDSNTDNLINKWDHYFEIYDRHFSNFRNKKITVLEIGIAQGGSLKMWKNYFGDQATIIGVDIDPRCKQFEEENVQVYTGSQEDRIFLRKLASMIPKVDILIDDGGHMMQQQIVTFEELYAHVKEDGVYLCEDLHTSYWGSFGGGYKRENTFIEYSKNFIDNLNAWHSQDNDQLSVSDFTKTTYALHYYDSVLVIEKRRKEKPTYHMTGKAIFE